MDDLASTRPVRPPAISDGEMARRRKALRQADASNRIEGQYRSPESAQIFEAFINGEIEMDQIPPRLKALHHRI